MGTYVNVVTRMRTSVKGLDAPVFWLKFAYKVSGWFDDNDKYQRRYVDPSLRAWRKAGERPKYVVHARDYDFEEHKDVPLFINGVEPVIRFGDKHPIGHTDHEPCGEVIGLMVKNGKGRYIFVDGLDADRLNQITKAVSAFKSLDELLNAAGNYRPTIKTSMPEYTEKEVEEFKAEFGELETRKIIRRPTDLRQLADAYDKIQEARGDSRRAHRY